MERSDMTHPGNFFTQTRHGCRTPGKFVQRSDTCNLRNVVYIPWRLSSIEGVYLGRRADQIANA